MCVYVTRPKDKCFGSQMRPLLYQSDVNVVKSDKHVHHKPFFKQSTCFCVFKF